MAEKLSGILAATSSPNNKRLLELVGITSASILFCFTIVSIVSKKRKEEDDIGPIVYEDAVITEPDKKLWDSVKKSCIKAAIQEPLLEKVMQYEVLRHPNLESSLSQILSQKLGSDSISASELKHIFDEVLLKKCRGVVSDDYPDAFQWPPREGKYDLATLIRSDLWAVKERDPACLDAAQALLYFKGFQCLQAHRISHILWKRGRRSLAFFLQGRCSEVWAMDIHPAAVIGKGVMFDHGTGLVIGETAVVGDGCSILHGVTLGGTGKRGGKDRHPKLGDGVLIGAHASILGNVKIGKESRVGCGSVVMTNVPEDSTAVGIPAKIAKKYPYDLSGL